MNGIENSVWWLYGLAIFNAIVLVGGGNEVLSDNNSLTDNTTMHVHGAVYAPAP